MHFAIVTLLACVPTLAAHNDVIARQILALKNAAEAARAAESLRLAPLEEVLVQLVAALQLGGALDGAAEGRMWAYEWLASAVEALPEGGHGIADPRVLEPLRKGVIERDVSCARALGHKGAVLTDAHPLLGASSVAWLSAGWTTREMEHDTLGMSSQTVLLLALRRGIGDRAVVRARFEVLAASATGRRRAIAQQGLAALDANG